jgi:hypothetical protein
LCSLRLSISEVKKRGRPPPTTKALCKHTENTMGSAPSFASSPEQRLRRSSLLTEIRAPDSPFKLSLRPQLYWAPCLPLSARRPIRWKGIFRRRSRNSAPPPNDFESVPAPGRTCHFVTLNGFAEVKGDPDSFLVPAKENPRRAAALRGLPDLSWGLLTQPNLNPVTQPGGRGNQHRLRFDVQRIPNRRVHQGRQPVDNGNGRGLMKLLPGKCVHDAA